MCWLSYRWQWLRVGPVSAALFMVSVGKIKPLPSRKQLLVTDKSPVPLSSTEGICFAQCRGPTEPFDVKAKWWKPASFYQMRHYDWWQNYGIKAVDKDSIIAVPRDGITAVDERRYHSGGL